MGKITKKSINALMDIYKRNSTDTVLKLTDPDDNSITVMEIALKTSLTIPEKGMFVDRVVLPCFDADGDFMPQYLDPLFMITLLQMTTNVPVIEDAISIPNDDGSESNEKTTIMNIEKTYELCRAINLMKNVSDTKYQALVNELRQMVTDKLAYIKELNMRKASNSLTMLKPMLETFQSKITEADLTAMLDRISNAGNQMQTQDGK